MVARVGLPGGTPREAVVSPLYGRLLAVPAGSVLRPVGFEEGQEFGLCWVRAVGGYVIPVDIHHNVFHGVLREGGVVGDVFVGDVPGCFGGCAEKWRAFPLSHLEGVGDDEFDVVARVDGW